MKKIKLVDEKDPAVPIIAGESTAGKATQPDLPVAAARCFNCGDVHNDSKTGLRLCAAIKALKGIRDTIDVYSGKKDFDPEILRAVTEQGIDGSLIRTTDGRKEGKKGGKEKQ